MDRDLAVGIAAQDRADTLDFDVDAEDVLPHRREPTEPTAAESLGDRFSVGERHTDDRAVAIRGVALLRRRKR